MVLPIGMYLLFIMYALCFGYSQYFGGSGCLGSHCYDQWPMHFCKALFWKLLWIKASAKWINVSVMSREKRSMSFITAGSAILRLLKTKRMVFVTHMVSCQRVIPGFRSITYKNKDLFSGKQISRFVFLLRSSFMASQNKMRSHIR